MPMTQAERNSILAFHRTRLCKSPVESLGWRTEETQQIRFEILCRWGDLHHASVLDLGCGYGDFALYLHERYTGIQYTGFDLVPEFIAKAKKQYAGLSDTQFLHADFLNMKLPRVDVIFASGSLNYRCEHAEHPFGTIQRMWDAAKQGIAFNLLDTRNQPSEGILQAYHPDEILPFCKTLATNIELIEGYHPEDFTLLMRKIEENC